MAYVFKPGTYKTRDGRKAVVLCDDAPGLAPLKGYATRGGDESASYGWRSDGRFTYEEHGLDLMPPEPETVVRWVISERHNPSGDVRTYLTSSPLPASLGWELIARTRVVLTPGRFDDENTPSDYDRGWNEVIEAAIGAVDEVELYGRDRLHINQAIRALKREGK